MGDERVDCPVCQRWVTKSKNGTLHRHKASPRWVGSKKLTDEPPGPWCPGGGKNHFNVNLLAYNQVKVTCYNSACKYYNEVRVASHPIISHGLFLAGVITCECGRQPTIDKRFEV